MAADPQASDWKWERVLKDIFGAQGGADFDRAKILAGAWFRLDSGPFPSIEPVATTAALNYPAPNPPDANALFLSRIKDVNYEVFKGWLAYFEKNGQYSAKDYFDNFHTNSSLIVNAPLTDNGNAKLGNQSFWDAGATLKQVVDQMKTIGDDITTKVEAVYGDFSGFQGNAADAFAAELQTMRADMTDLHDDLHKALVAATDGAHGADIVTMLQELDYTAIYTLAHAVHTTWAQYGDTTTFDPGYLIKNVSSQIFDTMHTSLYSQIDNTGTDGSPGTAGSFSFTATVDGTTLGPFQLDSAAGWSAMDAAVKQMWQATLTKLDDAVGAPALHLSQLLEQTATRVHGIITDPDLTPGDTGSHNDTGGNDGQDNPPGTGGGDNPGGTGGSGNSVAGEFTGIGGGGGGDSNALFSVPVGGPTGGSSGGGNSFDSYLDTGGGNAFDSGTGFDSGTAFDSGVVDDASLGAGPAVIGALTGVPSLGTGRGTRGTDRDSVLAGLDLGNVDDDFLDGLPSSVVGGAHRGVGALAGLSAAGSGGFPGGVSGGAPIGGLGGTLAPAAGPSAIGPLGSTADRSLFGALTDQSTPLTATATGNPAATAAGATGGGSGGSPMTPPMGSGAGRGGDQDQDRQRNAWLPEDDVAWGTDPGAGPAVVGRSDEKPARTPRDRPRGPRGTAPTGPVRPPMPGREQA